MIFIIIMFKKIFFFVSLMESNNFLLFYDRQICVQQLYWNVIVAPPSV